MRLGEALVEERDVCGDVRGTPLAVAVLLVLAAAPPLRGGRAMLGPVKVGVWS